jgi:hypothetical protein
MILKFSICLIDNSKIDKLLSQYRIAKLINNTRIIYQAS